MIAQRLEQTNTKYKTHYTRSEKLDLRFEIFRSCANFEIRDFELGSGKIL